MLDIDTPTFEQQRQEAWRRAAFTGALVIGLAFLLRGSNPEQFAWATNFLLVFAALLIEAMPFVLLGAVAAAIIEIFVPISAFERLARIPRSLQVPSLAVWRPRDSPRRRRSPSCLRRPCSIRSSSPPPLSPTEDAARSG
jgi:hypothetical protein